MAERPVFAALDKAPHFRVENVSFQYFSGFAEVQKKKSIQSLHNAFLQKHPTEKVLEISSKSENEIGVMLSAFNLLIHTDDNRCYSVESAFQASKVFERGGPYKDLLNKTSREAKKDMRLKESGRLKAFYFSRKEFPLYPRTYFYNWLYINSLQRHPELTEEVMEYTSFTDIEFNPEKSINCQACAAAIYVSLKKEGLLKEALENAEAFLKIVYGSNITSKENFEQEQLTMWD